MPGGWWIIDEPELHFIQDQEVDVPDLAGWRRERMPSPPEGHRFERDDKVAIAPFEAVTIDLTDLWMPEITDTRG